MRKCFIAICLVVMIVKSSVATTCVTGTLYPKPNCNEYYKCSAGTYISYTCPTGQHFSTSLSKCTTVQTANCFCKNLEDGKYPLTGCYSNGTTEQYVICKSQNVQAVSNCTAFFVFDAAEPQNSYCTTEALGECRSISTGFCTGLTAGNHKIPGTCTSYMSCTAGFDNGTAHNCSIGTVYSEKADQCLSDINYPISCGGTTGVYMSLDGLRTDIRYYAKAIQPFNVLTGLSEIISDTPGKYSGAAPSYVNDSSAKSYGAYSFVSDYLLPATGSIDFVGNPDWALIVDLRVETVHAGDFEVLNFQSTTGTKYAALVLGSDHFEVQCPCHSGSQGSVVVKQPLTNQTAWYKVKLSFVTATSTLNIYLTDSNTIHVQQTSFKCFLDCGVTTTGNTANLQIKQGNSAACLLFLSQTYANDSSSAYQNLVCPKPSQSGCTLTSDVGMFITSFLATSQTTTMICGENTVLTALVGCGTVPSSAICSWTDYNTFECTNQTYYTTWDEDALCYGDISNPRAIFPFNYITQLRDVSYGHVGQIRDAIKTQTIDQSNVLKLYDGRFVIKQALGLNFQSSFYIRFTMLTTNGVKMAYRDGDALRFSVSISYDPATMMSMVSMATSFSSSFCVISSDIRNATINVEIALSAALNVDVKFDGVIKCTSGFMFTGTYGDFELQTLQSSSNDYTSISCLVMLHDVNLADLDTILTYCNDITKYYTVQLLSLWPFNVVSSTTDLFGLNDVTSPSFLTYDVFEDVPSQMPSFSALNISAVAPYPVLTLNDFRSDDGAISDDFSISFWLYAKRASILLNLYSADGATLTFQLSMSSTGAITAGVAFNIGWTQFNFTNTHSFSTWHFYTFSMKRRDANNYDATLMSLNFSKTIENQQRISIQMPSNASYLSLTYTRGSTANIVGATGQYISCMSYLDRAILTEHDAINLANLCPILDVPCDYLHSTQVAASSYILPDPSVFNTQLDTNTSLCKNDTLNVNITVESFCLVDRTVYLPTESCAWSIDNSKFECEAHRTLISPPCGSAITSVSLETDYASSITCPALSAPPNGSIHLSNPRCSGDTVATFSCTNGSRVVGSNSIKCRHTGSWNGTVPSCNYVDCGDPTGYLLNSFNVTANLSPISPTYYNAKHYVSCIPGYIIRALTSDNPSITCQSSGEWSDPGMVCERGYCGLPDHGFYHVVEGTSMNFDDTVLLKCISGTQFSTGEIGITKRCNESLMWTPDTPLPDCVELKCPPPPIENADVMFYTPKKAEYSLGDDVNISCFNDSYQIIGEKSRSCRPDQTWSGSAPYCQIRACPDPGETVGGTRSYLSLNVNETVTYTCDEGFYLSSGNSVIMCLPTGLWDGEKPTFTKIDCGLPANGTNTVISFSSTNYNDTALYSCDVGYSLVTGNLIRQCLADKSWSGTTPSCTRIFCPFPSLSNGTEVNGTAKTSYLYSETIKLMCSPGYRWSGGSFTRSCTVDTTWSGQSLICEPKICTPPYPRGKMASFSPSGQIFSYLTTISYTCLTGYIYANGSMNRTCLEDGSWSGTAPVCAPPPGEQPATNVAVVVLKPTEAEHAAEIGIPVGALFLGLLFGLLAMLDILSIPKYWEFAKRRMRKGAVCSGRP